MAEGTTDDRILDAAERLLARLGYRKMAMVDLAAEAGVAKRTIYLHFPGKQEVALGTIDRIVERLLGRLRAIAGGTGDPGRRLRAMLCERVLFRFDSVRGYSHGVDDLFRSVRPAYLERRARWFEAEAGVFAPVIAEGIASGAFAPGTPGEAARTLLLATNALLPSALSTRELGERPEVAARVDRVASLLIDGLRARDGPGTP